MREQTRNTARTYNPEKEQAWRQKIAEWSRSGQSQVAFCRERQISRYRFVYWKRRLESNDISGGKVSLVHVADISGRKVRAEVMRRTSEGMFFTVNGKYRIEVGEGFGGETLKRLLDVLEGR
jgi:transposase